MKNCMNFVHHNVRGLLESTHFEEISSTVLDSGRVDVCCVTETYLRKGVNTNKSVAIDGFRIIRADWVGRKGDRNKGGGVAVYLKNCFKSRVLASSLDEKLNFKKIDFLITEIFFGNRN